jgi:hypothetical protein
LLLLNIGTTGTVYCLCPSQFAPDTHLTPGRTALPLKDSKFPSFVITGKSGREHLLAIITEDALELDWMTTDHKIPARVLSQADVEDLIGQLRTVKGDRWVALSTYFDVM